MPLTKLREVWEVHSNGFQSLDSLDFLELLQKIPKTVQNAKTFIFLTCTCSANALIKHKCYDYATKIVAYVIPLQFINH